MSKDYSAVLHMNDAVGVDSKRLVMGDYDKCFAC